MSVYVQLTELKGVLGIKGDADDSTDDGELFNTIVRASAAVDRWLEQNRVGYVGFGAISSNSRTAVGSNTRTYRGDGDDWLWIDDHSSVASIEVDDAAIEMDDVYLWPENETPKRAIVYAEPASSIRGLTVGHWPRGSKVEVTGFAGLDHVPADVEQTTLAVAILYWRRYQSGEPAPIVRPKGAQGFVLTDPEVEGLLESGLSGWASGGVYGG